MKLLLSILRLVCSIWIFAVLLCEVQGRARIDLLPKKCGKNLSDRIAGGNVTLVFEFPWMAIIRYFNMDEITDRCGGSLINERYVLTAAHCIRSQKLHSVVLGEHTKGQDPDCNKYYGENGELEELDCAEQVEEFGIESFAYHPDYNRPKFSNDIGLIRLDRSVTMKDHIQPICLPVTSELRSKTINKYIVTGWGTTENNSGSNVLLQALLPRVSNDACQEMMDRWRLNIRLGSKQLCAGGENKVDTCRGDSGGPLGYFANHLESTRFIQFGIVSVGTSTCGQHIVPGVYSKVADYMNWILENIHT